MVNHFFKQKWIINDTETFKGLIFVELLSLNETGCSIESSQMPSKLKLTRKFKMEKTEFKIKLT
jgi:hypothetical protein